MEIDIKKLDGIKNELASLDKDDTLYIMENGSAKYALLPIDIYDALMEEDENEFNLSSPSIKVIAPGNIELSYDEYEAVKKRIIDAFDKTFKPKREKLN